QIRSTHLRTSISLDGRLDEAAWTQAVWISDFVQKRPREGAAPSDSMRIAIFYDDDAIYVGARMFSRDPSKIQAPLSRRDNTFQSERMWVSFDSYHDKRTAYSFGVSASGVRADWYHASDDENDINWGYDPVWEGPINDRVDFAGRRGGDVKMGLGPNITLDGTVNPDFGQVEADPAFVNLSGFEQFFDERRPFFTEGNQLLRGNGPSYFYSRRIGARPGCNASGDFVDCPHNATILGAAKVTGRLATGMSLGVLTAVTRREFARTYDSTTRMFGRTVVAPPAGYGVMRLQQEFGASKSVVGVTFN